MQQTALHGGKANYDLIVIMGFVTHLRHVKAFRWSEKNYLEAEVREIA